MKRRRRVHELTPPAEWESVRDEKLQRSIASELGIRPEAWRAHDSGRPDLADGAGLDMYAHLQSSALAERAAARLRFLAGNDLLTAAESRTIRAADPSNPRQPHRLPCAGAWPCSTTSYDIAHACATLSAYYVVH